MPRKPAPTALKILKGTQPCRVNRDEPAPRAGSPDAPPHLSAEARAEWDLVFPELDAMGVLTRVDGPALAVYCEAAALRSQALKAVEKHGVLVETANGNLKCNPACAVASACWSAMTRVLASFGADPSSRSRVKCAGKPEDDFAAFQRTGGSP